MYKCIFIYFYFFFITGKALDTKTNKIVALKQVRMEREKDGIPPTFLREIKILKSLNV